MAGFTGFDNFSRILKRRKATILIIGSVLFLALFSYFPVLVRTSVRLVPRENVLRDDIASEIIHTRSEKSPGFLPPPIIQGTKATANANANAVEQEQEPTTSITQSDANNSNYYDKDENESTGDYEPFLNSWSDNYETSDVKHLTVFRNDMVYFSCESGRVRRIQKRNKNLVVFENFIAASANMQCHESITYTTHGDYRYLDNLIPLVDRWNGPVSIAIYSPGDDLRRALNIISFLRDCTFQKIRLFVTFHIFLDALYADPVFTEPRFHWLDSLYEEERWKNCSKKPHPKIRNESTFRLRNRILYPVNIARNIARSAAPTHFVLASDVELYPSLDFIPSFFKMLLEATKGQNRKGRGILIPARQVYVLPIFEVKRGIQPPGIKSELISLLETGDAIPFHNHICKECHLIPKFEEWVKNNPGPEEGHLLHIFHTAKRKTPFQAWEPIYVGTKYEPPYDERLSWEGLRDKMTQGYILCALDYDFQILDKAFLVHRPGIKRTTHKITTTIVRQDKLIDLKIKAEFLRRFGKQDHCVL